MKKIFKTVKQNIPMLLLSIILLFGIFHNFTFPLVWGDGVCQTLDEDDIPNKKPTTPND